jgi:hypothetical protein
MRRIFGVKHLRLETVHLAGPNPEPAALLQPTMTATMHKKHSTMAGTRSSGELLAEGAVCQRMKNSRSSTVFVAATFRRRHLIYADDVGTFQLRCNSVGCYLSSIAQLDALLSSRVVFQGC